MRLPYYLGCPSWSENAWRDYLYPPDAKPADFLNLYSQVFNAVEGNTTFYASPAASTVQRWAEIMPEHFRFTAKFPGDISHGGDLREQLTAADTFLQLLSPLGERVSPLWLQLSKSFTPHRLPELAGFIDALERPLAVEVRHDEFFAKGDSERRLNRLLLDRGVERICLDPRALFSCTSTDPSVLHVQSKKPRVPPRPAAFTQFPQVRFIGHPQLEANDPFLEPWVEKIALWIEEGRTPYIFLHTADNLLAAKLAQRFHAKLMLRLPGLPPLPELYREPAAEQLGLLLGGFVPLFRSLPMDAQTLRAQVFKALHEREGAFVIPNPWDAGSAKMLASLGFEALATTSAGYAFSNARPDGGLTLDDTLANVRAIVAATDLPVAVDLENGFADDPAECAQSILAAAAAGAVGGSIEDATGREDAPIYCFEHAVARIEAAVAAARSLPFPFMLTARAENFLHGNPDLAGTIRRLQAFAEAGADVLYAPGLRSAEDVLAVVRAVAPKPVNVLMSGGLKLTVEQLSEMGVKRISVGSALALAAYGEFYRAAEEIKTSGTFGFTSRSMPYAKANQLFKG